MSTPLSVEPECLRFTRKSEAELRVTLERSSRTSDLVQLGQVTDLTMRGDSTLPGGLRFTSWSLYQLTKLICPGLYKVLQQLTADGADSSKLSAIGILNQVVRLRFDTTLSGNLLLLNRPTKTIEAIVSPRFKLLSNHELFEQVDSAMGAVPEARFYEAELHGRWFLCRYYVTQPFVDVLGYRYHEGFHFANHEGGRSSLHGANSLVRAAGGLCMLMPITNSRQARHAGRKFKEKFQGLLGRVLECRQDLGALQAGLEALARKKLGLGAKTLEPNEDRRHKEIQEQFVRRGVPQSLAARFLGHAITQPFNQDKPETLLALTEKDFAARSALDLMTAVCRDAKACPINIREKVEAVAYGLVTGSFKLR